MYSKELVNKTINLHLDNSDKIKTLRPEKCVVTLKLPILKFKNVGEGNKTVRRNYS